MPTFPYFGNYGLHGPLAAQPFSLAQLSITDLIYPEYDHYEQGEWFNYAEIHNETGRAGNLVLNPEWNFFIDHEDHYGMVRGDSEYYVWSEHGSSQVSRPQRFLYGSQWEGFVDRFPRRFRVIGGAPD